MIPQNHLWQVMRAMASTLMPLGFLILGSFNTLHGQCPLTCLGQTQFSLGENGATLFMPAHGLSNVQAACLPDYSVMLTDIYGQPVDNPIGCQEIGKNLTFKVTYDPNGNHCWGQVLIEDKLAPDISCVGDTINCNMSSDPSQVGFVSATDNCDADPEILLAFEQYINLPCGDPNGFIQTIERHWVAVDTSGNQSGSCSQFIYVRRAFFGDITFPPNMIGDLAIPCDSPNINPSITGEPLLFGAGNDPLCKIVFTYQDDTIPVCAGAFTVLREWTAMDCCTNETITDTQIIEVRDVVPPVIDCPVDIYLNTKEDTCTADVLLPIPTAVDNCSDSVSLEIVTSWGGVGPGPYPDMPEGGYLVHYIATDSCNNVDTCTINLTIKDKVPPVALCKFPVQVFIGLNGVGQVTVSDVDAGSYDNCSLTMAQIKLMGEPDSLFRDTIEVDCGFIGVDTMVVLRVEDCWDNFSFCMTSLIAIDTLPPVVQCPQDVTLFCEAIIDYPNIGGEASATDNCTGFSFEVSDSLTLNDCNIGEIYRTYIATDTYGNEVLCEQQISLVDTVPISIVWPDDITLDCSQPLDPSFTGAPIIEKGCALLAVGMTDSIIMVDPGCDTLYRIWRVKDWCSEFDTTYTQKIDLIDTVPILIVNCQDDITVYIEQACEDYIILDEVTSFDECGHFVDITNDSPYADASGADASGTYPMGEHIINFTIRDACSTLTCFKSLSVQDTLSPILVCEPLTDCIGADSTYLLDLQDMVDIAFSPCGSLSFFSENIVFDCDDIMMPIPIAILMTDTFGRTAQCVDTLFLLNCDVCFNGFSGNSVDLKGQVVSWDNVPMAEVPVIFDFGPYQDTTFTNEEGMYASPFYPKGINLHIYTGIKQGDMEGVTTEDIIAIGDHIVRRNELDEISSMAAADVNFSDQITVADMIMLRKAILDENLKSQVGSWRSFPDMGPVDPDDFKSLAWRSYQIEKLQNSETNLNFKAIKVGDVNQTTKLFPGGEKVASKRYVNINGIPATAEARENIKIDLAFDQDLYHRGFQLEVFFDTTKVMLKALEALNQQEEGLAPYYQILPGRIRIAFHHNPDLEVSLSSSIAALSFQTITSIDGEDWIGIEQTAMPSQLYLPTGGKENIVIQPKKQGDKPGLIRIDDITPNPFSASTRIPFELNQPGQVLLQVYHLNGTKIIERTGHFNSGLNDFLLEGSLFPGQGVYTLRLAAGDTVFVRHLVYTR